MAKSRLQLQTMVVNNTGRSDKTSTVINDGLDFAQEHLTELHNFQDALKISSVSLANATVSASAPSDFKTSNESRTHQGTSVSISAVTASNNQVTTSSVHGLTTGDLVTIDGNTGTVPDINGVSRQITVVDTTNFTIDGVVITTNGSADGSVITGDSSMSPMREIPLRQFLSKFPSYLVSSTTGRPTWFAYDREGGNFLFSPQTDQAYIMHLAYYKLGDPFVDNDANPLITGSEEALVAYASAFVFRSVQAFQDAERWDVEYTRQVSRLIVSDQSSPGITHQLRPHGTQYDVPPADYVNNPFVFDNFERES